MSCTAKLVEAARTGALVLGVLGQRRKLRRRDSWGVKQLLDHQAREVARLRQHAYAHSPFYRQFHAETLNRPLNELPVLTKSVLMEHSDQLVTARDVRLADVERYLATLEGNDLFHDKYYVSATAGTTGRRGIFLWNFAEWVQVISSYNRASDLPE